MNGGEPTPTEARLYKELGWQYESWTVVGLAAEIDGKDAMIAKLEAENKALLSGEHGRLLAEAREQAEAKNARWRELVVDAEMRCARATNEVDKLKREAAKVAK